MHDDLIDRIYEAAFVPELWPGVLASLKSASDAADGRMFVFDGIRPIGFKATEISYDTAEAFVTTDRWKVCRRIQYFHGKPKTGFAISQDYYSPSFLDRDQPYQDIRNLGLESQVETIIPMPSGELVAFIFEKWARDGNFSAEDVQRLDLLYPHLARAGLVTARLGLERARATVSALQAIGLPAAVLTDSGRVLTANSLFEGMPELFQPAAHGHLAIADASADALFQEAVVQHSQDLVVRSIPVPARKDQLGLIVHVLPLRRAAHDIFSGGDILVAATAVSATAMVPSPTILTGLFDLTPAEARLAIALASGRSVKAAAMEGRVTLKTGRTYLERIFRKTGTSHQGQLVALLKSAQALQPNG
jgi:DNA-binding CsgD family transcriptional regulator